jgi:hypothetical protein
MKKDVTTKNKFDLIHIAAGNKSHELGTVSDALTLLISLSDEPSVLCTQINN